MDKISYYLFYCQTSNKKTMEKNEHFIQVCNYFFTGKQQVPAGEQPRLIFVFGSPGPESQPILNRCCSSRFKRRLPVWKSMN